MFYSGETLFFFFEKIMDSTVTDDESLGRGRSRRPRFFFVVAIRTDLRENRVQYGFILCNSRTINQTHVVHLRRRSKLRGDGGNRNVLSGYRKPVLARFILI